ncbi:MAG TPA: putative zinc-binding metallopeptidase [Candidatus Methylomirabilis sp.]|nr:putative zinc-binding metallopeptidase [Candidatus Methylomirabilis sp.]
METTPRDLQPLLSRRISQLGLRLEGSPVERSVQMLYRELWRKGLKHFRPPCYLTDEWGCPSGEPIIGIPFYLADPKLARLEKAIDGLEDRRGIRMYLRHEAGHAFNYAYKLYETAEWRELFGPFSRPYRDRYKPVPFDRSFVRHIEGWYAQKHPDEDFAETFAVWLTPGSRWRLRYRGWPALLKLRYVNRVARDLGGTEPLVRLASTDITTEEMHMTVEEFFRTIQAEAWPVEVALENDLPDIFIRKGRRRRGLRPAWEMIRQHRTHLIDKIEYWTGVKRSVVRSLVDTIGQAAQRLQLSVDTAEEPSALVELTAYASTLSMNFLTRGSFVPRARRTLPRTGTAGSPRSAEAQHGQASHRDSPRT